MKTHVPALRRNRTKNWCTACHHSAVQIALTFTIALVATSHWAFSQEPNTAQKTLLRAIAAGDVPAVEAVLEKENVSVKSKIGSSELTVFDFTLLCDNIDVFRTILRRAHPLSADDLSAAAGFGLPSYFKTVLRASTSNNIKDYLVATELMEGLSAEVRAAMRAQLIDNSLDKDAVYHIHEAHPRTVVDTTLLDALVEKMSTIAPEEQVKQMLLYDALQVSLGKNPNNGSDYLLDLCLFQQNGPLGDSYDSDTFKKAFEKGRKDIVEAFLRRGAPLYHFKRINFSRVDDLDLALSYFVRMQLVDTERAPMALARNREWTVKNVLTTLDFGVVNGKRHTMPIPWHKGLEETLGDIFTIEGFYMPMGLSGNRKGEIAVHVKGPPDFSQIGAKINHQPHTLSIMNKGRVSILINIPQSDSSWGEFHGIEIENTAVYGDIDVLRNDHVITSIPPGETENVSRRQGPVAIRYAFEDRPRPFGFTVNFNHRVHRQVDASSIRMRLEMYRDLLVIREVAASLENGVAAVDNALTKKRLISEQLREANVPSVVAELLRGALNHIATFSAYDAAFTNYVIAESQELPTLLSEVPQSISDSMRSQISSIQEAQDRRRARLRILKESNILSYTKAVRAVESLLFELAQYYSADELTRKLNSLGLSAATRAAFRLNLRESSGMLAISTVELDGKGSVIRDYLSQEN